MIANLADADTPCTFRFDLNTIDATIADVSIYRVDGEISTTGRSGPKDMQFALTLKPYDVLAVIFKKEGTIR